MRLGCSHLPTTADSQSRLPPHPTGNVASEAWPDPAAGLQADHDLAADQVAWLGSLSPPCPHRSRIFIARYLGI